MFIAGMVEKEGVESSRNGFNSFYDVSTLLAILWVKINNPPHSGVGIWRF